MGISRRRRRREKFLGLSTRYFILAFFREGGGGGYSHFWAEGGGTPKIAVERKWNKVSTVVIETSKYGNFIKVTLRSFKITTFTPKLASYGPIAHYIYLNRIIEWFSHSNNCQSGNFCGILIFAIIAVREIAQK